LILLPRIRTDSRGGAKTKRVGISGERKKAVGPDKVDSKAQSRGRGTTLKKIWGEKKCRGTKRVFGKIEPECGGLIKIKGDQLVLKKGKGARLIGGSS